MYKWIRPLLYALPAEQAHYRTMDAFSLATQLPGVATLLNQMWSQQDDSLLKDVAGLTFKNPLGLAAGFDKDGRWLRELSLMGFGFVEVGTVTPRPQIGNPKPRLFRLQKDEALINRMGFNNGGVDALVRRLSAYRPEGIVLGGNIGKNKDTPNENAADDYEICFRKLHLFVDYFVVNVSSPNTPGLRALQAKEPLLALLGRLQNINQTQAKPKPIFLKIAPDLNEHELSDIADITHSTQLAGIIATNTTIERNAPSYSPAQLEAIGNGGLSGRPLRSRSTEVIRMLRNALPAQTAIIGVGGISSAAHAQEKLDAGADLIQLYTGLIYKGPTLVKTILKSLSAKG